MSYTLKFTDDALEDIEYLKKSGDKSVLKKLAVLLEELTEHPRTGTGQPEELKYDLSGCWSRRINSRHRLVYRIEEKPQKAVIILYSLGHYNDK
jgi:toxin YoeB